MGNRLLAVRRLQRQQTRAAGRRVRDAYPTPPWCLEALLAVGPRPMTSWVLEPSAGEGSLVRVLVEAGYAVEAVEIREECRPALEAAGAVQVTIGDFLGQAGNQFGARPLGAPGGCGTFGIVGNPPYSQAFAFARRCVESSHYTALLLRAGFWETTERARWLSEHPPSAIRALGTRPSFTGDGTDGTAYAWFVWTTERVDRPFLVLTRGDE